MVRHAGCPFFNLGQERMLTHWTSMNPGNYLTVLGLNGTGVKPYWGDQEHAAVWMKGARRTDHGPLTTAQSAA